jgi:hypothetical protein
MPINETAIDDVIITGDFNDNQLLTHSTYLVTILLGIEDSAALEIALVISFVINSISSVRKIDEPTHFTEHSSSLIDLILTNNVNRLIYTGVGPALTEQIRYHCPVIGFINYPKTPTKPFKRKIWLYEHADYEKLRQNLFNVNWDSLFLTDDINIRSINDDECSVKCVGSSIICKRLNLVKRKLILVRE